MLFPFEMFDIRHFLNMTMSIYTSISNTCILQNIPEYKNAEFRFKNENILMGFLSIHDRDICKSNKLASYLKQVK